MHRIIRVLLRVGVYFRICFTEMRRHDHGGMLVVFWDPVAVSSSLPADWLAAGRAAVGRHTHSPLSAPEQ